MCVCLGSCGCACLVVYVCAWVRACLRCGGEALHTCVLHALSVPPCFTRTVVTESMITSEAQGRLCVASLLSITGVVMPSSRPDLVDHPRVARESPEAAPLTSSASCVLTVSSADIQTWSCLKIAQPCGLKNDLLRSKIFWACSRLENRDSSRSGVAHCARWVARLHQQPSPSCIAM